MSLCIVKFTLSHVPMENWIHFLINSSSALPENPHLMRNLIHRSREERGENKQGRKRGEEQVHSRYIVILETEHEEKKLWLQSEGCSTSRS